MKSQLDIILLFAALFSAINSAFLIYTLPNLAPTATDTTNLLLLYIIQGVNNDTYQEAANLVASSEASGRTVNVTVNQIFSVALMLSLIATLGAVIGQTWVTTYNRRTHVTPDRIRMELQHKIFAAERWYFQPLVEVILPVILQLALILFTAGFLLLLWSIDVSLTVVVMPLAILGFGAIGATVGFAIWDPDCPFKTPLSHNILPTTFSGLYYIWRRGSAIAHFIVLALRYAWNHAKTTVGLRIVGHEIANSRAELHQARQFLSRRDHAGRREFMKDRELLANRFRRVLDSSGALHAQSILWTIRNSADPMAAALVRRSLMYVKPGSQANDLARHPIFRKLAARALPFGHIPPIFWSASYPLTYFRIVSHIFLAAWNIQDRSCYDSMLRLYCSPDSFKLTPATLRDGYAIAYFAAAIKLLTLMPLFHDYDTLPDYVPFQTMEALILNMLQAIIGVEGPSYRDLHFIATLLGALNEWDNLNMGSARNAIDSARFDRISWYYYSNSFPMAFELGFDGSSRGPVAVEDLALESEQKSYISVLSLLVRSQVGSQNTVIGRIPRKCFATLLTALERRVPAAPPCKYVLDQIEDIHRALDVVRSHKLQYGPYTFGAGIDPQDLDWINPTVLRVVRNLTRAALSVTFNVDPKMACLLCENLVRIYLTNPGEYGLASELLDYMHYSSRNERWRNRTDVILTLIICGKAVRLVEGRGGDPTEVIDQLCHAARSLTGRALTSLMQVASITYGFYQRESNDFYLALTHFLKETAPDQIGQIQLQVMQTYRDDQVDGVTMDQDSRKTFIQVFDEFKEKYLAQQPGVPLHSKPQAQLVGTQPPFQLEGMPS